VATIKKGLKIPQRTSETVIRGRIDNITAKNNNKQRLTAQKTKDRATRTPLQTGENSGTLEG
jgi:hypothetical protein